MKNLVLFASGSGSNAENIIKHFATSNTVKIKAIFCNNPKAGVLDRAKRLNIPTFVFNKNQLQNGEVRNELLKIDTNFIVLAGFLLQLTPDIINQYPNQIINIHPALLPKYGGKGMYGHHVHDAVVANKETETGITIHYVNENYDEGAIIEQQSVALKPTDTADDVANKIHTLEHHFFPLVIDRVI